MGLYLQLKGELEEASKQKGGVIELKIVIQNKTIFVNIFSKSYHVAGISIMKKIKKNCSLRKRIQKTAIEKKSYVEVSNFLYVML